VPNAEDIFNPPPIGPADVPAEAEVLTAMMLLPAAWTPPAIADTFSPTAFTMANPP
jgi:hypothetical protein